MSTRIQDSDGDVLDMSSMSNGKVYLWSTRSGCEPTRADFLAAVAAECDVIVIDRAELPERVSPSMDGKHLWADAWSVPATNTPDIPRRAARAYLALAEYLDAHPPVDEAQVEALAAVMREALNTPEDGTFRPYVAEDAARRLLATGRIEVKP